MTRLRCAILDDYFNVALTITDWSSVSDRLDVTVFKEPFASPEATARALADFEIICAMRERTAFPRSVLTALPKLKLLLTSGPKNAAIDMEAAKERGIVVCGTVAGGNPTAALTLGLILELTRGIGRENARMHAGEPLQKFLGIEIEGKTLGIVGLGNLGARVAEMARAMGMQVIAWSENLTAERCREVGVTHATRQQLFATADIVTIHIVLSDRSRGLVGQQELGWMKPTSYLVNTSRAPIVDEAALLQALKQRQIAGAALDVFSVEPLPVDHPLRGLDNAVLTPHLGYVTEDSFRKHYQQMVANISAWMDGGTLSRRLA